MPGDADDDGDDVAFDEGMEPESATGDVAAPGDDDDNYDDGDGDGSAVATGGAVARVISAAKGTRSVSPKVRELMADMAKKYKAAGGLEDELEPLEHEDAPMEPPTLTPEQLAAKAETPPDPQLAPPPPSPTPGQPDPEIARIKAEIADRQAALEAREKQIAETERTGDLAKLRDVYFDKGAPAVVEILKKWSGLADGDELKDEIADLITDLSIHIGVDVPQAVRESLENRRTRKGVKVWKAEQERVAKEQAQAQETAKERENRVRVMGILQQEITKAEHANRYPWLSAEPNAGEIILDVVEEALAKDGTKLKWDEAAKRANDYLQQQSLAWFGSRKHLLVTDSGQGAAAGGQQPPRNRETQQGSKVTAQPPKPPRQPPPTPPPAKPEKWDPEAHRKAVKAKHRNAFTRTDEE
jgi:hypothetical protein